MKHMCVSHSTCGLPFCNFCSRLTLPFYRCGKWPVQSLKLFSKTPSPKLPSLNYTFFQQEKNFRWLQKVRARAHTHTHTHKIAVTKQHIDFFFSQLFLLDGGWFFFLKHKMIWKPWGEFVGEKQQNAHGRKNLRRVFASDICTRSWRKWWTQIHKKEQQGNSVEGNRIKKIHD